MPPNIYDALHAYAVAVENEHRNLKFKPYTLYNKSIASTIRTALMDKRTTTDEVATSIHNLVAEGNIDGRDLIGFRKSLIRQSMLRRPRIIERHVDFTRNTPTQRQQATPLQSSTGSDQNAGTVDDAQDDNIFGNSPPTGGTAQPLSQIAKAIESRVIDNLSGHTTATNVEKHPVHQSEAVETNTPPNGETTLEPNPTRKRSPKRKVTFAENNDFGSSLQSHTSDQEREENAGGAPDDPTQPPSKVPARSSPSNSQMEEDLNDSHEGEEQRGDEEIPDDASMTSDQSFNIPSASTGTPEVCICTNLFVPFILIMHIFLH